MADLTARVEISWHHPHDENYPGLIGPGVNEEDPRPVKFE
jgi:hypothetical protein